MKRIIASLLVALILTASSISYSDSTAPDPIDINTLIYRLSSRAHLFDIIVEDPTTNSINDKKGLLLFSGFIITYNIQTGYVQSATLVSNTEKEDGVKRYIALVSSVEIGDVEFYRRGYADAASKVIELYKKILESYNDGHDYYVSPSGYNYMPTDEFDVMIYREDVL